MRGDDHPAARLTADDVALARLMAADRSQPHGWMKSFARARGVTRAAVCMAIGGQTWADLTSPAPVVAWRRVRPYTGRQAPLCPRCQRRKCRPRDCTHVFHTIDHRAGGRSRRPA